MAAPNSGLAGLEKLARQLGDTKDKRGWPRLFPPGLHLHQGLTGLAKSADGSGTGALRELYAGFLDEAATILDRPALREVATSYRSLAEAWRSVARTAQPGGIAGWQRDQAYPLDEAAAHRLLAELGEQVGAILEQERAAAGALEAAVK
jgi:hypothetical protein